MGTIYKRGSKWWIKWHRQGRAFYESSESESYEDAKNLLRLREGDVARGVPITPAVTRVLTDELLADVVIDYEVNGRKSIGGLRRRIKLHLTPAFGGRRAASITPAEVQRYAARRQDQGASNAEINRELAALRRAFYLARDGGKILAAPKIKMLTEDNVRQGFFERNQFEAVRSHLPAPLKGVVSFAYVTGWRVPSEVLPLQWRQVDFSAGRVRLEPGTTKNRAGRWFPFTVELRTILEHQRAYTDAVNRDRGILCPWVFHRAGERIHSLYDSWRTACLKVGLAQRDPKTKRIRTERIPHDFRRTAVRNLIRAGISERVAMTMTGHKTRAIFDRYHIVSDADLTAAAERLDGATVTETVTSARSKGRRSRGKTVQLAEK